MTIIAGFPTTGFVVLGADGEEGDSQGKFSSNKIAAIQGDGYSCLIGGAGNGEFCDLAVQEIRDLLTGKVDGDCTRADIRRVIEQVVTDIYQDRIDLLPAVELDAAQFRLLCVVWTEFDKTPQLVRVGRGLSLIQDKPDVLGLGSYLAKYLISTLALRDDMQLRHWQRLCAYVLNKAKDHVQGCGGHSQIVTMNSRGAIETVPQAIIQEDEYTANMVMDHVRGLFTWTDLVGWKADSDRMDQVVDTTANWIKRDLRQHVAEVRSRDTLRGVGLGEQRAQSLPKRDPKDPPPSPE